MRMEFCSKFVISLALRRDTYDEKNRIYVILCHTINSWQIDIEWIRIFIKLINALLTFLAGFFSTGSTYEILEIM